jgi:hypothetical protein
MRRTKNTFGTARIVILMASAYTALTMGPLALAQTNYGSVVGTVTDSTGASIAGAQVVLKNNGTNAIQTGIAGSAGGFTFLNLIPGSYTVTVTNSGFKVASSNQVDVTIGGTTRVDESLQTGEVSETVNVNAASEALQTDNSTLGGVVEGRQVEESPLNGRNVNNLLDFIPGVTPGGGTQGSTVANGGSGNFQAGGQTQAIAYGNYQIGGGFSGQSLFYYDGMGQNVPENNVNALVPTQDAVQEFRVSTNNISPEFGGFGGGVIQISGKTGTNKFHGNAYEYFRNTALNANDWFSNHAGLGKSPLHQNQFGANLGGPLLKDKAFFFFSFERETLTSTSPTSTRMPTTAELSGDFSADFAPGVQGIYNPVTRAPYVGNIIPVGQLNATAVKILQLETPNELRINQNTNSANPFANNVSASAPIEGFQNQYNARVDYSLGKADQLFARYTYWNPHNGPSDPFGTSTGAGTTGNLTQEGVVGDTHLFNASTIADLRVSYLENYNFQNILSSGFNLSSINPNYGSIASQNVHGVGTLPGLSITGYGLGAQLSQLYWENTVYGINGSLSKVIGKHTLKLGGNWRQVLWTSYSNGSGPSLSALQVYSASSPSDSMTGNALASFLLNAPSSAGASNITTQHAFLHNYGFFINDTFQATKKLTLTLGLRWEQPGAYSEENDLNTVLQPNAAASVGGITTITNPVTGTSVPLTTTLALVNSPAYTSRREEALHYKLFSPRLGFAYRIDDKTVARGGYGISYLPSEITQDGPQLSPVGRAVTNVNNTPGQPLQATVDNPLPNGVNQPLGHTQAALDAQLGFGLWARVPDQKYGSAQQYNLAVERALDRQSTISVAYAGAKGTHLVGASAYTSSGLNLNQLPNQYHSLGSGLLTQVKNPFFGQFPATSPLGGATVAQGYLLLPHPQYPLGVLQQAPRFGISNYNALQIAAAHHFSHQGIVQLAYTWSKLLSSVDNTSAFQDGQGGTAVVQDNYNLRAEYSLSEQDLSNNLVINYGIDLPYGRGQTYGAHLNKFANAALGGWRVNGITIIKSGLPLALVAQSNGLSTFGGGTAPFGLGPGIIRPNYTAGCNKNAAGSPHSNARVNAYFNTSCFTQPGNFSFGSEGRVDSGLKSQGGINFDFSANKTFNITELVKLKFTSEIFDIFNHAQFAEPNLSVGGGGFGQVTHQVNLPRTVQLALRASF